MMTEDLGVECLVFRLRVISEGIRDEWSEVSVEGSW